MSSTKVNFYAGEIMRKWLIRKQDDDVVVAILKNKADDTYSFVNLTKEHICPCRFKSMEDAISDMERQKEEGKIIRYFEVT